MVGCIGLDCYTKNRSMQIKYYLEGEGKDSGTVKNMLEQVVKELETNWMQAVANGLTWPEQS